MNVAFDPWIPVMTAGGKRELVSLEQVFSRGTELADLAVRPHERVALMRLFLCVAHAALNGPCDLDDWLTVPERLPEAAHSYLETWRDWFELFDPEKPWLQVAEITKTATGNAATESITEWTPVSKLNFTYATGNNTTLFDHEGLADQREIPLPETILALLTFQCFSPGGLISQVYWNGIQSSKSSKDAPCAPASMAHAFLRGENLQTTVQLNLPTQDLLLRHYPGSKIGRPVWEMRPLSMTDAANVANATQTYLGRLTPMTRLIPLHPSAQLMLLGDGLVYPTFADGFPAETTATVIIKKDKQKDVRALLSYRPNKALWRELGAMVVKRKVGDSGGPLAMDALLDADSCDLIVAALARDQATIVDTTEAVFHIPAQLLTTQGTQTYDAEAKAAEDRASRLGWAIETYRREIDNGWEGRLKSAGASQAALKSKLHSQATTHYWTTVEGNLDLLFTHVAALGTAAAVPTLEDWRKQLFRAAIEAYHLVCGQDTPRQLRAFAKGLQKLTTQRAQDEADDTFEKEEEA